MKTFYIYEVIGHKNGATIQWDIRSKQNFDVYGIQPIIIETMEGPNEPEFWQIVGDREWELADQNGYPRGTHYRVARETRPRNGFKDPSSAGKKGYVASNLQQYHEENSKKLGEYRSIMNKLGHNKKVSDDMMAKGIHPSQRTVTCDKCGKKTKGSGPAARHKNKCMNE